MWLDKKGVLIGYFDVEWLLVMVLGYVYLDLMEYGIIFNFYEWMYEIGVQWVDQIDWSYCCIFMWEVEEDKLNQKFVFEGFDIVCIVFLNGEKIVEYDNMFVLFEVNVIGKFKVENQF